MGKGRLAAGKKNAARLNAALVFLDESGLLMAPLLQRSWALRGHTPVLYQRTRLHQKVSVIAALCITPQRDRLHLYFRLHPHANITARLIIDFLRQLRRQLPLPLVLLWDRLRAHRAKTVADFLHNTPAIHAIFLPPYAPELNPIEYAWGYLKHHRLANHAFFDTGTLAACARAHGRSLQRNQALLRSFIQHSALSLHL